MFVFSVVEKKKKAVQRCEEQLLKMEVQATDREENKQIALGTSKLNYLDPRITVAWWWCLTQIHKLATQIFSLYFILELFQCFLTLFSASRCKNMEVPLDKIYNKSLRDKFAWAVDMTEHDFVFWVWFVRFPIQHSVLYKTYILIETVNWIVQPCSLVVLLALFYCSFFFYIV